MHRLEAPIRLALAVAAILTASVPVHPAPVTPPLAHETRPAAVASAPSAVRKAAAPPAAPAPIRVSPPQLAARPALRRVTHVAVPHTPPTTEPRPSEQLPAKPALVRTRFAGLEYGYTLVDDATSTQMTGRLMAERESTWSPLPDAEVVVGRFRDGELLATTTVLTDGEGGFSLTGEAGSHYQVDYLGDDAHQAACISISVTHVDSMRSLLTASRDGSGTITLALALDDAARTPLSGLKLDVERQEDGAWTHYRYCFTDGGGDAALSSLPAGDYCASLTDGLTPLPGWGACWLWGSTAYFSVDASGPASQAATP